MNDAVRLAQLLRAKRACISIATYEEAEALEIVKEISLGSGVPLLVWSSSAGLRDGMVKGISVAHTEHPAAALLHARNLQDSRLLVMLDAAGYLSDEKTLRLWREAVDHFEKVRTHLILIDHKDELPAVVRAHATPFELTPPGEKELEKVVRDTLRECHNEIKIKIDLSRDEFKTILRNLRGLSKRQARQLVIDAISEDRRFDIHDVNTILANKRRHLQSSGLLEYVESPVDLSEIGGLTKLKGWLEQRRNALSDDAIEFGLSAPRGVLMLGVQGAGKSLSAKAVATAWQRPLLRMDVGALFDKYVGETERNLRDCLHQAEAMSPIILWVDEIEKAFASSASTSTDGGLSRRMLGTLLTWMQEHTAPVFLIATANDIEALPPEMLRKGRFDEIFFVDLPDVEAREAIFGIHLKKRKRKPERFDLKRLATQSEGYSGAEIEQAVLGGLHAAFAAKEELSIDHLSRALRESPPLSVTMAEKIQWLRRWAQGRCVPAN